MRPQRKTVRFLRRSQAWLHLDGRDAAIHRHNKGREARLISEHTTGAEAFAEIDQLSAQMVRTGAPSDAVELSWWMRGPPRRQ
jgi:hypothetical protein